jgi:hypothetical protein
MNCRRVEERLSHHLEGRLSTHESGVIESHLEGCSTCRRLRDEFLALAADLRVWEGPPPPADLERDIAARWCAETDARRSARTAQASSHTRPVGVRSAAGVRWLAPGGGSLAAGVLLAAFGFFLLYRHHGQSGRQDPLRLAQTDQHQTLATTPAGERRLPAPRRLKSGPLTDRLQGPVRLRREKVHSARWRTSKLQRTVGHPGAATAFNTGPGGADAGSDLTHLYEDPVAGAPRWTPLPKDRWDEIEARVRRSVPVKDDFVQIPFPRVAATSDRAAVAAAEAFRREAAVVDTRLARPVTCAFKATALADLCDHLRADTGIPMVAGNSVADEKVTVFCKAMPLREVMRQLSRPFGYTWMRSRKEGGEYRYELVQDLRSQLLEEELRNRDQNTALLTLEREIQRYRLYRDLSPDEALARIRTAPPEEKPLLEKLAGLGWGPIQMYFRLSPQDLATLRAGDWLNFSVEPSPGERPLPPDVARGVLQSLRDWRILVSDDGFVPVFDAEKAPNGLPPAAIPEMRARVILRMDQSELGQFVIEGMSGAEGRGKGQGFLHFQPSGPLAVGMSAAIGDLHDRAAPPQLARDPSLRLRVTLRPVAHCGSPKDGLASKPASSSPAERRVSDRVQKTTTADVMEALHGATGMPIISDFYTRLYPPEAVVVRDQPLFEAIDRLADATRLRWHKEGDWLQFRSRTYYDDRLKEVPNRLLSRWAAARRRQGMLTLDDLCEIAKLPDAQLDGAEMAEGARECFGLVEWELANSRHWRPHLRFLAGFTSAQRQEAMSPLGLAFTKMPLAQQQAFLSFAYDRQAEGLKSLEEVAGATLFVDYSQPGWFEWRVPGADWLRWVTPLNTGKRAPRLPVRGRTREATLQAARQVDPQIRQALLRAARQSTPPPDEAQLTLQEAQIVPTQLDLAIIYIPGTSHQRSIRAVYRHNDRSWRTW